MTEYEKMINLLDAGWCMRSQIVPCLVGPPGIGKTAAVMEHAKAHGCGKVVKIVASRCVPSETVGMTMPDHRHRSMEIYNSMQLSSLNDGDILFLDELLEADQYVLSTLLTVIESREMADGTPLPDIQIIAATNDTIPPEQLKPNIRQRFMFMRFKVDMRQTHDYIMRVTGMDLPNDVMDTLTDDGKDYNFITPRTLTKLCMWVNEIPADKMNEIASIINDMFKSTIGHKICHARMIRDNKLYTPEKQVRNAVDEMRVNGLIDPDDVSDVSFDDCTMSELLEILHKLPEWDKISEILSNIEIMEPDENVYDVSF